MYPHQHIQPLYNLRQETVWQCIISFQNSSNIPYLLIGDYNEVLDSSDRGSQRISGTGSQQFDLFLQEMQVFEIPASNGKYTWFRGHSKRKLDRLFIRPEWITTYPSLKVSLLKRTISDHCPLLVQSRDKNWGPRPFRFLNCWLSHPSCSKVIKDSWSTSLNLPIAEKLKVVRGNMRTWNKAEFGKIDEHIKSLEDKIQATDNRANEGALSNSEVLDRKSAQTELWGWLRKKESYWAQNSRLKWLKEGDRNTRYFHTVATMRKRKNQIDKIAVGGEATDDPSKIKQEAVNFYKKIFHEDHHHRPTFQGLAFNTLNQSQATGLVERFSHKEIDQEVASCDASKAPGPDGFNFTFIKNASEVIKSDVYGLVQEFWKTSRLPRGCNTAFIALIPKSDNPMEFKDYRPISMVGCLYKIISKLLPADFKGSSTP